MKTVCDACRCAMYHSSCSSRSVAALTDADAFSSCNTLNRCVSSDSSPTCSLLPNYFSVYTSYYDVQCM